VEILKNVGGPITNGARCVLESKTSLAMEKHRSMMRKFFSLSNCT
jgi:hypothetical protein